ncbi:hypothetical protein D3C75_1185280 [compost metagenome]
MKFVIDRCCSHIHLIIEKLIHRESLFDQLDILLRIKAIFLHKGEHLELLTTKPCTNLLALHLSRIGDPRRLLGN